MESPWHYSKLFVKMLYWLTIVRFILKSNAFVPGFNHRRFYSMLKSSNGPDLNFATDASVTSANHYEPVGSFLEKYSGNTHNPLPFSEYLVFNRTTECLELQYLLCEIQNYTTTIMGKEIVFQSMAASAKEARLQYARVEQLGSQASLWPLSSPLNVNTLLLKLEMNTGIPEKRELEDFSFDLEELQLLRAFMLDNKAKLDLFDPYRADLALPDELVEMFRDSFDEDHLLNARKFPIIRNLRVEINQLKEKIAQAMEKILHSEEFRDKLADSSCLELYGRSCIMLKNTFKKGVGIVHGSSNTGRTLYVEPFSLVEPTNELKALELNLKAEENKIYFEMCRTIFAFRGEIRRCVQVAAMLDVILAKWRMGENLGGSIPLVESEGLIYCEDAKHPLLLLKNGKNVVGNTISVGGTNLGLVISGPNAGGKTVVLKTAGLYAFMAKYGIPIPAKASRRLRVDYFDYIFANIGDMQSLMSKVELSTFSGHLVIFNEILQIAHNNYAIRKQSNQGHLLVLLDEVGTGTDPAQGQALAQSLLEELISLDARFLTTTHFSQVKDLALKDRRLEIAAMEWLQAPKGIANAESKDLGSLYKVQGFVGRPTYRMKVGHTGDSHALELAEKIFLTPSAQTSFASQEESLSRRQNILHRARALLDDETRKLIYLQEQLDIQKDQMMQLQREYSQKLEELRQSEEQMVGQRNEFEREIEKFREGRTEKYLRALIEKEQQLESFMARAQEIIQSAAQSQQAKLTRASDRATASSDLAPQLRAELQSIQSQIKVARVNTEKEVVQRFINNAALDVEPLEEKGDPIEAGCSLIVLEPGNLYGSKAVVAQRNKGKGRVSIRVGGVELKLERHLLGKPNRPKEFLDESGSTDMFRKIKL